MLSYDILAIPENLRLAALLLALGANNSTFHAANIITVSNITKQILSFSLDFSTKMPIFAVITPCEGVERI